MAVKSIYNLIPDIYDLVQHKKGWFDEACSDALRTNLASRLTEHFNKERYNTGSGTLRLSGMGPKCPKALWYSVHHPDLAEPLPPWAEVKFAYGHVLEGLVITFAKAAGHEVVGEQDELVLDGITGHRDCIIDGCIVDVKSASSIAFGKFKSGAIEQNDSFGYLDQLDGYVVASRGDARLRVQDRGYLLAVDKTLGHMTLHEHQVTYERERTLRDRISYYKTIVGRNTPPSCECGTKAEGASGNIKLDTVASYSPFKHCCFPNLRTFIYQSGPVYLTKVVRKPDVKEVDKHGKTVYTY